MYTRFAKILYDILYIVHRILNIILYIIYRILYIIQLGNTVLPRLLKVTIPPFTCTWTIYMETKFSLEKSIHSIYNLKTKLRTFPGASRVSQSKFEANRSRSSCVMIRQTNKQTKKHLDINRYYIFSVSLE